MIILLPDQAAVDIFKRGEGVLENARAHDSASSVTDGHHPAQLKAYGIDDDVVFIMPLTGEQHWTCLIPAFKSNPAHLTLAYISFELGGPLLWHSC